MAYADVPEAFAAKTQAPLGPVYGGNASAPMVAPAPKSKMGAMYGFLPATKLPFKVWGPLSQLPFKGTDRAAATPLLLIFNPKTWVLPNPVGPSPSPKIAPSEART
jgi:hypothetical protein